MARPILYDRPALDDAVFGQISEAASRGARSPSIRDIGLAVRARRETVRASLERLKASGRLVDRGAVKAPAWFIPETGRETARVRVGRPPSVHNRKGGGTGLTPGQREVLSIARQLARQGIEICAANIADRVGLTREGTLSRLVRIAGNGYLRPLAPGRWCLETALARHPADDAAAMLAAESFLRFLTVEERPNIFAPTVGAGAAELSRRGAGASPAEPHPSDAVNLPAVAAPVSPRGRESNAESTGASASDGAASPKPRQRAPARTDLPLTDGERTILEALLRVGEPGVPIPEGTARQATGIWKAGPAVGKLRVLERKGYLKGAISPAGARVWRVTRDPAGKSVAPAIEGSRIEIRDDLPVPVTVCPTRWARGSVESQYQR